jgi:hypothetical protein
VASSSARKRKRRRRPRPASTAGAEAAGGGAGAAQVPSGDRAAAAAPAGRDRRAARAGRPPPPARPPAPWGRFPLVELVVLLSVGLLVAGFLVQGTRGITMIVAGVTLGSLAGLELSLREHFAGYRSHTTVLAGVPAVLIAGLGFFLLPAGWPQGIGLVVAVAIFIGAFYLLREAFKRRSGGLGFR